MVIYISCVSVSLILPKCARLGNPKMSIVYCGAPYIHDPIPLDNSKT